MKKFGKLLFNYRAVCKFHGEAFPGQRVPFHRAATRRNFSAGADRLSLESLNEEQICQLLHLSNFSAVESVIRKQGLNGVVLAHGVESAQDLIEVGVKPLPARALFKFITRWKSDGLPVELASQLTAPVNQPCAVTFDVIQKLLSEKSNEDSECPTETTPDKTNGIINQNHTIIGMVSRPVWMNHMEFDLRSGLDDDYHKARCSDETASNRVQDLAISGSMLAKAYMSMLYGSGSALIPYDTRKADEAALEAWTWLHAEAAKGCPFAQYCLGCSLVVGRFGEKDEKEALRYLRLAADQHHAGAVCALGWCYQAGLGVTADATEAIKHYQQAADKGHVGAVINLGNCYEAGFGTEPNEGEAYRCFLSAAKQGHPNAQFKLGVCYQNGRGVAKDDVAAVKWYRLAAQQGQAAAQYSLGECYEYGIGTAHDAALALEYYQQAADRYHAGAIAKLNK